MWGAGFQLLSPQAELGVLGPGAESTGGVGLLDLKCRDLVRVHKQDLQCWFCLLGCWIRLLSPQAGSGVLGVGAVHRKGAEKEVQGSDLPRLKSRE